MSKQQRKTLLSLALLLALLAAALLGVRSCKAKEAAQAEAAAQAEKTADYVPTKGDSFTAIAYDNSITNLSFARDEEENWIWADDPDFPLDGSYLDSLSALIVNLDPMQTITDGDTLDAYGLETPSGTITATAADGAKTVLILGKALSDGSYYLKTDDSDTVYVVASALHDHIAKGVYELAKLEEFPALTVENLVSVSITGTQSVKLTLEPGTNGAVWRDGEGETHGGEELSALTEELSALAFTACVDFKPSEKAAAICGFDAPAVLVEAVYKDEKGEEQTLRLTIGTATTDETGRYARLGDSTTIHRLERESIATILSLAVNGLSA